MTPIDAAALAGIFILVICFAFANQAGLRESIKPVPKVQPQPQAKIYPEIWANDIREWASTCPQMMFTCSAIGWARHSATVLNPPYRSSDRYELH